MEVSNRQKNIKKLIQYGFQLMDMGKDQLFGYIIKG
jgi:hypothetical protein